MATTAVASQKFPPQIKYIVGNEGCERYSYYGMRSILQIFMIQFLFVNLMPEEQAKEHATEVMHLFMGVCYLLPLFGSLIADYVWGRYKTILFLSLFYCLGHGTLAAFENSVTGVYVGLGLIALGSGGIKPCISAFLGDQFRLDQKTLLDKVYYLFYFMINFGSFFSTIFTPLTLKYYGPSVAFGIPGILMFIATFIFWLGRKQYVKVPPSGADGDSFWAILVKGIFHNLKFGTGSKTVASVGVLALSAFVVYAAMNWGLTGAFVALLLMFVLIPVLGFIAFKSYMEKNHPKKRVEEFYVALGIIKVFAMISVFWALFDQHASTWVVQASQMVKKTNIFGYEFEILESQVSAVNPVFVMLLIPVFTFGVYPFLERFFPFTALRRMGWGFMVAATGFAAAAFVQYPLDQGGQVHILWQGVQYFLMTVAEVMISITGLTFAYTQAPKSMKSVIMSFWLLTVFIGNLLTAVVVKVSMFPVGSGNFYMFFAGLIFLAGLIFAFLVRNHQVRDYMEA
ncbi:MAG: oligopeptide:H+ symporter [Bdellovibrionales bacterium]|nr:oligopeptide:H+ symporter [Bdellovibrionales bacterium]